MGLRIDLHEELCTLLGSRNVYYEPPESLKLKYPCIIYEVNDINQIRANNRHYLDIKRYSITYVTNKNIIDITEKFFELFPTCSFDRSYVSDNLWHYVFTLSY